MALAVSQVGAFTPHRVATTRGALANNLLASTNNDHAAADNSEIIARRIIVIGDVQGGYYRSCVLNEASRFRRLVGTMSPPDSTKEAEIYVEGSRKMVEGFVRWCQRGNVGLSQMTNVKEVIEEMPTGLYDGFYTKTH